jgi:hypothetical protein
MIAILVTLMTALLVGLIVLRRVSPEFRRRAEAPKYRFLANLGVATRQPDSDSKEPTS